MIIFGSAAFVITVLILYGIYKVLKGAWNTASAGARVYTCSNCGAKFKQPLSQCPNCGVRLRYQ